MIHVLVTLLNNKCIDVSNVSGHGITAIADYIALLWFCNLFQIEIIYFPYLSV